MYGFLTRKGWEQTTCNGLVAAMKHEAVVRASKEEWPDGMNMIFRWGCTADVPTKKTVNHAPAIHLVADKPQFRAVLRDKAPHTIPITWFKQEGLEALAGITKEFPVVVRPNKHERGKDFDVCHNLDQVVIAMKKYPDCYISKFYKKKYEYRVMIVQGRVAFVVQKIMNNPNLAAWGRAAGWNTLPWSQWPLGVIEKAVEAHKHSGLHFSAADVILDVEGSAYVCELNTAPELGGQQWYELVGKCFDWMLDNNRDDIPVPNGADNWKQFIHPAISEKVVV